MADHPSVVVLVVEVLQLFSSVHDPMEVEDNEVDLYFVEFAHVLQVSSQLLEIDVHIGELGDHAWQYFDCDLLPVLLDERC